MPAPSPVFASHPHAPRCCRLMSTSRPRSTTEWERTPLMLTTNPTPQASCSKRGSYRPSAWGGGRERTGCAINLGPRARAFIADLHAEVKYNDHIKHITKTD